MGNRVILTAAAALLLLSVPVLAQTAPAPLPEYESGAAPAAPAAPKPSAPAPAPSTAAAAAAPGAPAPSAPGAATTERVVVQKTRFSTAEPVKLVEPKGVKGKEPSREVSARLADLMGDPRLKDHPVGEVMVRGRWLPVERRPEGLVVRFQWESVELPDGSRRAQFPDALVSNMLAEIDGDGGQLDPGTQLPAYGDVDGAVTAIRSLFAAEGPTEAGQAEERPTMSGGGNAATRAPEGDQQNDIAAQYQPLQPKPEDAEPEISVEMVACPGTEKDLDGGFVYTMEKSVTLTDGQRTESECERKLPGYPIKWTNEGCSNVEDVGAMLAQAQRRPYWVNIDGDAVSLGACEPDSSTKFRIIETAEGCPIVQEGNTEIQQTRLVYEDAVAGKLVVVDGCSKGAGSKSWTTEACAGIEEDFKTGTVYTRERLITRVGDEVISDSGCQRKQPGHAIEWTYEGCDPVEDLVGLVAQKQRRPFWENLDGQQEFLRGCEPAPDMKFRIRETADGCPIVQDGGARVQQTRLVYDDVITGELVEAQGCQKGTTSKVWITEVCPGIEPDLDAGVVFTLERVITKIGDEVIEDTGCQRKQPGNTVKWTYDGCNNVTNTAEMVAIKTRMPFWVNLAGENENLADDCLNQPDVKFPIKETAEGCYVDADTSAMVATAYTRLIYEDTVAGRIEEVEPCLPRDGAATWAIKETRDGCELVPDYDLGKAYLQTRFFFERDGVEHKVQGCEIAQLAGEPVAFPIVEDVAACPLGETDSVVYEQSRFRADTDKGSVFLTQCAPSGKESQIQATVDGCEAFHVDYMGGGYSRGGERLFHTLYGQREYLSACQESTRQLTHDLVREGWVMDDSKLQGTDKLAVFIDLPQPAGRTLISAAAVRSSSVTVPYVDVGTTDVETGETYYNECNKYQKTRRMRRYERPDGSFHEIAVGDGAPVLLGNVCTPDKPTAPADWHLVNDVWFRLWTSWFGSDPSSPNVWRGPLHCHYEGTLRQVREDGVVVSTQTAIRAGAGTSEQTWSYISQSGYNCPPNTGTVPGYCAEDEWVASNIYINQGCSSTPMVDAATVQTWLQQLGW